MQMKHVCILFVIAAFIICAIYYVLGAMRYAK